MKQEMRFVFDSDALNGELSFKTKSRLTVYQLAASLYLMDSASYCHVYVEREIGVREFLPDLSFGCKCGSNE